jgi:serine/threonine protein kinase
VGATKTKESSFLAELNAFGLKHPNVVKILTFTCLSSVTQVVTCFCIIKLSLIWQVVYEYVGHRTLARIIFDNASNMEQLPIERRMRILTEVADALEYCHSQHIVHLDVKPHNVLLTDLPNESCKLADFGCSRRLQFNGLAKCLFYFQVCFVQIQRFR